MAYLAVDADGAEYIYDALPERYEKEWKIDMFEESCIGLPMGSIKKLIGRELTWDDEPVELK